MDEQIDTPAADGIGAADDIGFTPDAAQLARRADSSPAPTWLAASIAVTVALLLGVSLAVRPAAAVTHGATGDGPAADAVADAPGDHAVAPRPDLFELPAWHDGDEKTAVADAR